MPRNRNSVWNNLNWSDLFSILIALCFIGYFLYLIVRIPFYLNSATTTTITVKKLQPVVDGSSYKYLVWTEENEVFQNDDSYLIGKWNSSDVEGQLQEGHRYKVDVIGWRKPFFSWYRNIVKIDEDVTPPSIGVVPSRTGGADSGS